MEVQVGLRRMAGVSAFANLLSQMDGVACGHGNAALAQMGEKTELVLPMLDQDMVSPDVAAPHVHRAGTREPKVPLSIPSAHYEPVGRREDRLAERRKVGEASAFPTQPLPQPVLLLHEVVRVALVR